MSHVLVLRAPGTNCDLETAYAFEMAGAKSVQKLHINRVLEKPSILEQFQVLCFPGGFSFGDDIAAGRILATILKNHLSEPLQKFKDAGKLILGICNGFQILIKSGLLVEEEHDDIPVTLTWNDSRVYTGRWALLKTDSYGAVLNETGNKEASKCVFLRGMDSLYLPVAHAEGKFMSKNREALDQLRRRGQIVLQYDPEENPNSSLDDIAGLCDTTGRIFGLMPHPERYIDPLQHPHWTRIQAKDRPRFGDGFKLFTNAVEYFQ